MVSKAKDFPVMGVQAKDQMAMEVAGVASLVVVEVATVVQEPDHGRTGAAKEVWNVELIL